jgi:uncharacterized membrane protein YdbT with pleckstrin-like domain
MPFEKDQLLPDENLIIRTHQHSLVLLKPILLNVVSLVILAGITYVLKDYYWILLFVLAPVIYLVWEILIRHSREYIVTDRRVVKQEGMFSIHSFDAPLDKVNNVFHEQNLIGRMFGYGNVGLETASEQGTTLFEFIPDPVQFKNAIVSQRERRSGTAAPAAARAGDDIPRLLNELASLRDRNVISAAEFEAKKKALLDRL